MSNPSRNRGEGFCDPLLDLGVRPVAQPQTEGHVLENRKMREEGVALEHGMHGPQVSLDRGHIIPGRL